MELLRLLFQHFPQYLVKQRVAVVSLKVHQELLFKLGHHLAFGLLVEVAFDLSLYVSG